MTAFTYVTKAKPTAEELDHIRGLAAVCNGFEQINLKLNFDMLEKRPGTDTNDFFAMTAGSSSDTEGCTFSIREKRRQPAWCTPITGERGYSGICSG